MIADAIHPAWYDSSLPAFGQRQPQLERFFGTMESLVSRLYDEICKIRLLDPHSHVQPHSPVASDFNDVLGYHYYTELAHSAGLPKSDIEDFQGLQKARNIVGGLRNCTNTIQYSWLVELSQEFFGFQGDEINESNVDGLYQQAQSALSNPNWEQTVFDKTGLDGIFLTNDFDDPLEGFDTNRYIPCLRTDDLVFKLNDPKVRDRFVQATGTKISDWKSIVDGIGKLFAHFVDKGARACAISLPPNFAPRRPTKSETKSALKATLRGDASAENHRTLAYAVFYCLADYCEDYRLPFDLMIGVWRNVYPGGVFQGQDLYDKTSSLYQFRHLFNEKSNVKFPISVLTHNQNQELVSYSWIFPNVLMNGHWWYSNIPSLIEADTRTRLEAVPWNKQIGYYSDAYKLEFVLPKFRMYRRVLAKVLAEDYVIFRKWSEEKTLGLAKAVLRDNVESMFPARKRD